MQAFGDLARQPWSPLDDGKGMYIGVVGRVARDTLSRSRCELAMGTRRDGYADSITEDATNNVRRIELFDLRARVFYEPIKPGILAISKITQRILTMREVDRKSLLILSFFLTASKIPVTFEKLRNVQRRAGL